MSAGCVGYETNRGPEPRRQLVAERFGSQTSEVVSTAGTSAALNAIPRPCNAPALLYSWSPPPTTSPSTCPRVWVSRRHPPYVFVACQEGSGRQSRHDRLPLSYASSPAGICRSLSARRSRRSTLKTTASARSPSDRAGSLDPLARAACNPAAQAGKRVYRVSVAQWKPQHAAKRPKPATNPRLRDFVEQRLSGARPPDVKGRPILGPSVL